MHVLLAEDERRMAQAAAEILRREGYYTDCVFDGISAVNALETKQYDVIILDVMMPGMSGFEVASYAREVGIDTPILMLTAKAELDDKVEGLDSGADDYLTKPFDCKELLARLRAMTRAKAEAAGKLLKFGNVSLDRDSCTLTAPLGSVRLSGKEYQMMELLMRDTDRVISVEKFMNKVWGIDSDAEINVVWTFLSYLRKKLQNIGADIVIKASRGQGYHLEARGHDQ